MSQLVESLKRLYRSGKIDKLKLQKMVKNNKISIEEFNYIIR